MNDSNSNSRELQRLATIERNEGKEQLRISLDEFTSDQGRTSQYVSVRLWFKGDRGDFLPTKKGLTVRRGEIHEVGSALRKALDYFETSSTGRAQSDNRFARGNRQPTAPNAGASRSQIDDTDDDCNGALPF